MALVATIDSFGGEQRYGYDLTGVVVDKSEGTWWPIGRLQVPCGDLKWLLAQSAQWHARQSIRTFSSNDLNDLLQAATAAGTGVELLAKAYLASIDVALLAEKGDRDTVLLLGGHSALTESEPLAMKTIGALEALKIAKQLHKDLPLTQPNPVVFRVRNAACHMALVRSDSLRAAVVQMCRIVESLLLALDVDRRSFWGIHEIPAVDALLDEAKTEIARAVAVKKAAAASRIGRMLADLSELAREAVLAALSGRKMSSTEHEEPQECPVCEQQGWLLCSMELGWVRKEIDEDGHVIAILVDRTAYPFAFECPVCELDVEEDELLEFNFPRQIELEPEDAIDVYEPDEDMYRDR